MKWQGEFQITDWQEQTRESEHSLEGGRLATAQVKQLYKGDVIGSSELQYCMVYDDKGNAYFSGSEVLKAQLNGQEAILVLSHQGKFSQGVASSEFEVVASEPSHAIEGARGHFTSAENGTALYCIEKNN
ncbi:DUF3224 domain-containing protein [Pseudoalteromonas luteoviolacea]|uniref:DUF3224 domain-containing protein n=1 Tax=Pseudoalteromonas luteoviolacea DSM 6061 TaxID=1365250 RepID=A0A166W635_9GAMM|nr:DUF3224 domain-containing protein [Pseudoalteromonas luteoviolacea]KZN35781.1 hypothetical protein N475_18260 [Pseudoalteromonas luteoviolacea DSM 6061]MBE0389156.1 hypothetical protein [Pseudoalteromonas luteoviolacea DSM 6061]